MQVTLPGASTPTNLGTKTATDQGGIYAYAVSFQLQIGPSQVGTAYGSYSCTYGGVVRAQGTFTMQISAANH